MVNSLVVLDSFFDPLSKNFSIYRNENCYASPNLVAVNASHDLIPMRSSVSPSRAGL